ncbi:hypothetical protein J4E93_011047 [Alternaria ventricosa]|uniref:uncharacterized protein n=1 Tax=Alternaria ventricosa TaxID=1187951 RepID=UPI0020C2D127|nr:uncharacterized protein J4E93_011047 [Alternaria ventricosa]KAI4636690.1 hypothetical protein J4E93_011047 [Alternaria ventricosa]
MEPPLKRPRADGIDGHQLNNASDANATPTALSSTTNPTVLATDISNMIFALDKATIDNGDDIEFGRDLLTKVAVKDPVIAATIQEAYDTHLKEEKNRVKEFQDDIDQLRNSVPPTDETTPPEDRYLGIPMKSSKIQSAFYTSVTKICDRTYEYSSLGTKKNALDALRKLHVLLTQIPDKRLQAAVVDRINIDYDKNVMRALVDRDRIYIEDGRAVPGMKNIVISLTPAQREEVCYMPVDGETVRQDESGRTIGTFRAKFSDMNRDLTKTGFRVCFGPVISSLSVRPEDPEDEGDCDC